MKHIFTIFSCVCHCEADEHRLKQSMFLAAMIALFLFLPLHASAQTKEIVSEGAYNMGDGETPSVAESRALLNAKRIALEQAGTYVESYTKVENFQLTKDEIQVLASGIMEVEILDKKRTIVGDGFRFWVKIKARVNPDRIQEMAKKVKDKSVVEDYKKIQEAYDKSQREIGELKKQLAQAKGEEEKKQVEAKITDDERMFQANEWFAKGYQHTLNNEYDKAIEAYTRAIALNPNIAGAYYGRGVAYYNKGQYDRAIEDYNKAIALSPNIAETYSNRGIAYVKKGQHDRAIKDFNKAIALNPNIAGAYSNRGGAYVKKGQHDRAIKDFNKAIALNPNDASAYTNRGVAYYEKGNMGRAISDLQKACDLGDENGCKGLKMVLENR
ncbi:MAG: TPR repeat-containing protein YrrB [Syntrophomonadaceae bacterium]|nr:TPR repeat-containing protein YrrB [Bacillota bacterium]